MSLYGCNSTPREDGYMVRDGTIVKGSIEAQERERGRAEALIEEIKRT